MQNIVFQVDANNIGNKIIKEIEIFLNGGYYPFFVVFL